MFYLAGLRRFTTGPEGAPTLLLAVTGAAELPGLFAALARQTVRPRRLLVALESVADPAHAAVLQLAPTLPYPVAIVVAGPADGRGQKATGLIAAAAQVEADAAAVILLDADLRPAPDWLALLLAPLRQGRADVVTGGRWLTLPAEPPPGPARHVVAWLERSLALGPRLGARGLIWGGSAAIAGPAFHALDLPRTLDTALADDVALSAAARRLRLRVLVRRALLLPTPFAGTEAAATAFMLRQLRLLRLVRPGLWLALAALLLAEAAALPLLILALAGAAPATASPVLLALALAGLARAAMHDHAGRWLGQPDRGRVRARQWALGALRPVTCALPLPLLVRSAFGRRIRWRHLEYRVGRDGRPQVIRRDPPR